jgi:predicted extracellular nuclease
MKVFTNSIFLLCALPILIFAQTYEHLEDARNDSGIRVMFYNVENLFDTINDPLTSDEEFLPDSQMEWNTWKYYDKTKKIAQVIAYVGGMELPTIVGVCEVENRLVLENLIKAPAIVNGNYRVVHYDSPDRRGIDVGLLYRKDKFKLIDSRPLRVILPEDSNYTTRDILYVKGLVLGRDTLHLYVNHWPSRYGGQEASEYKRLAAANSLKSHLDSILIVNPQAATIIMGDFNDGPTNKSLAEILHASKPHGDSTRSLYNLMLELPKDLGSHKYRGSWDYLDQLIVSNSLLYGKGFRVYKGGARVVRAPFLLEEDTRYTGDFPLRAFRGPRYSGGFSDHLPVFVDLLFDVHQKNQ